MSLILRLIAAFCFLLAVFNVHFEHVLLLPLGLLFWVVATMFGDAGGWPGRRAT